MQLEELMQFEGRPLGVATPEFFNLVADNREMWARRRESLAEFQRLHSRPRNAATTATASATRTPAPRPAAPYTARVKPQIWRGLSDTESLACRKTVNIDALMMANRYGVNPKTAPDLENYRQFGRDMSQSSYKNIRRALDALGVTVELDPTVEARDDASQRHATASWMKHRNGDIRIEVYTRTREQSYVDAILMHEMGHHVAEEKRKSATPEEAEVRAQAFAVGFASNL